MMGNSIVYFVCGQTCIFFLIAAHSITLDVILKLKKHWLKLKTKYKKVNKKKNKSIEIDVRSNLNPNKKILENETFNQ